MNLADLLLPLYCKAVILKNNSFIVSDTLQEASL